MFDSGGSTITDAVRAAQQSSRFDMTPYTARPIDIDVFRRSVDLTGQLNELSSTQRAAMDSLSAGRREYQPLLNAASLQIQMPTVDWRGSALGSSSGGSIKMVLGVSVVAGLLWYAARRKQGRGAGRPSMRPSMRGLPEAD